MTISHDDYHGAEVRDADGQVYAFDVYPTLSKRAVGRHIAWLVAIGMIPRGNLQVTLHDHRVTS